MYSGRTWKSGLADLGDGRGGWFAENEIGGERFFARGVVPGRHHGLANGAETKEGRFDLAQLNTESADLHLMVDPAEAFQGAVGPPSGQIAAAIQAGAAGRPERVHDESLGRERGPIRVPPGDPQSADEQLARHAHRHRPHPRVEHVQLRARDRPADRDRTLAGLHHRRRGPDGRLRRPVKFHRALPLAQQAVGDQVAGEALAAAEQSQAGDPSQPPASRSRHVAGVAWRKVIDGSASLADQPRGTSAASSRGAISTSSADAQGQEQAPGGPRYRTRGWSRRESRRSRSSPGASSSPRGTSSRHRGGPAPPSARRSSRRCRSHKRGDGDLRSEGDPCRWLPVPEPVPLGIEGDDLRIPLARSDSRRSCPVRSTEGRESSTIMARRAAGNAGSSGRYAPPALSTARERHDQLTGERFGGTPRRSRRDPRRASRKSSQPAGSTPLPALEK